MGILSQHDSIHKLAEVMGTHWMQIWSGHHTVKSPDALMTAGTTVTLGPTYTVSQGDVVSRLAQRFGITIGDLKRSNPELADDTSGNYVVDAGYELCIMPETCVYNHAVESW